ncbi:Aste57867_2336 [Aphanomyces stellatus]|uniref:Aste57867_2336 protein n=1 Tax=Aphanomyces stellatus TaxID=120398 RepID=A0A485K9W7_9STRA|nr:hypothetical protein As57867_002331 [Aphanomyces stellatus]VFT79538.1 Aste57867_2336 [Aphanomyces stellatus]
MSLGTFFRYMKKTPEMNARSNYVKTHLTEAHRAARLDYAISFVRRTSNGYHIFTNMYDHVHVDEKWFFLTKVKRRYYVFDNEEVASRAVQSKGHITKVLFLAAIARPRYDCRSKRFFDGKLGVWPFVKVEPAQCSSENRPRGTPIMSPKSVTGEVYKDMILKNVVAAIKAKMPGARSRTISIQQDNAGHQNATSHCQPLDVSIMAPFKRHLRDLWIAEDAVEGDITDDDWFSPSAKVKRITMIKRAAKAWDMITPEQVRGSFLKALPKP